ncbi:MAG: metallophosphoesterase family protein [Thermomicrobiales bacterium]
MIHSGPVASYATPLTIFVIADTHIWETGRRSLPSEVIALLQRSQAELVLHAGDINDHSVLEELAAIAPVLAVRGNNDDAELQETLPLTRQFRVGAFQIGLIHGHEGRSARESAFASFGADVDLVVYGHSHIPKIEKRGKTVYFNPGSATDRRWNPHFGIGILRCTDERIDPHLILFTRPADLANVTMNWLPADH